VLETIVGRIIAENPGSAVSAEALYKNAIRLLVESLIASSTAEDGAPSTGAESPQRKRISEAMVRELGPLKPEQVGELYERLRGFRLELRDGKKPTLAPCVRGKRNQGLFYTPPNIVRLIVERTLVHLDISDPADYLELRILDPAVGTGRFLVEAMRQISQRVDVGGDHTSRRLREKVAGIKKDLCRRIPSRSAGRQLDDETAVRVHVLENCLFGLDIDPVAVAVTRAVLTSSAWPDVTAPPLNSANIRTGNALMGAGNPARAGQPGFDLYPSDKGLFHWPIEFPEIFSGPGGFDAIVGNPPYEILSVKESGIHERSNEQTYFRRMYRTCQGKINTYRLMLERGLELLRNGGVLGFIVPATLLADSSASKLRKMILEECSICDALVIPEKSKVFVGVTQSLLILVVRKGAPTRVVKPTVWDGKSPAPAGGVELSMDLIRSTGYRIPVLKSQEDKRLLEALLRYPALGGAAGYPAVATVHQGEINLTVHHQFITNRKTDFPLIRGEHVTPFRVTHPAARARLDWVVPEFFDHREKQAGLNPSIPGKGSSDGRKARGTPWESERIVLGRVVNMETDRRLKAALVPAGSFLGDMTNFIANPGVPVLYLLGLLNSRLLNRRMKLTSTNNYISAAEVEALPIPCFELSSLSVNVRRDALRVCASLAQEPGVSIVQCLKTLMAVSIDIGGGAAITPVLIEYVVQEIQGRLFRNEAAQPRDLFNFLDALVLKLYAVEFYAPALDRESSSGL
jgi:Alw26I/Eco31I/Esp3I family type II restriction m6 adenine DNA methyltransferase